jgi:hypothetical protein
LAGFRPKAVASNGDGPPEQTGLVTKHQKLQYDRNRTMKYSDIAAEYNGD